MARDLDDFLKEIAEDSWLTQIRHFLPSAWIGHAPFFKFLIRELKPKVFVELGTHNGFSYFVGCQTIEELNLPTRSFAVDHWIGDPHAGEFDDSVYAGVAEINRSFMNFSNLLKMSFLEATSVIPDNSVDLLHIDGFHTYEAVKEDFETWLPKLTNDAVIILHDIHVRHADFGVYKYWAELKKKFNTIEFMGSYGLGVIFLGNIESPNLRHIISLTKEGQLSQIQGVFGCLSDVVMQNYRVTSNDQLVSHLKSVNQELEEKLNSGPIAYDEIQILLNSKSWRLTKPLRNMSNLLRRIVNHFHQN